MGGFGAALGGAAGQIGANMRQDWVEQEKNALQNLTGFHEFLLKNATDPNVPAEHQKAFLGYAAQIAAAPVGQRLKIMQQISKEMEAHGQAIKLGEQAQQEQTRQNNPANLPPGNFSMASPPWQTQPQGLTYDPRQAAWGNLYGPEYARQVAFQQAVQNLKQMFPNMSDQELINRAMIQTSRTGAMGYGMLNPITPGGSGNPMTALQFFGSAAAAQQAGFDPDSLGIPVGDKIGGKTVFRPTVRPGSPVTVEGQDGTPVPALQNRYTGGITTPQNAPAAMSKMPVPVTTTSQSQKVVSTPTGVAVVPTTQTTTRKASAMTAPPAPDMSKGAPSGKGIQNITIPGKVPPPVAKEWAALQDDLGRYNMMQQLITHAATDKSGAADAVLLALHMGMSVGSVRGMRVGRDIIQMHAAARSFLDKIGVTVQSIAGGKVLSPSQRLDFLQAARERLGVNRQRFSNFSQPFNVRLDEPDKPMKGEMGFKGGKPFMWDGTAWQPSQQ